jgi:hypothetical protein
MQRIIPYCSISGTPKYSIYLGKTRFFKQVACVCVRVRVSMVSNPGADGQSRVQQFSASELLTSSGMTAIQLSLIIALS